MADDELDFVDEQSETTARSTDVSSSIASGRASSSQSSSSDNHDSSKPRHTMLRMGRSKHKRLRDKELSQSSSVASSSSTATEPSPARTRRIQSPTKKRLKTALTKIPEHEMLTYRNDHCSVKDAAQSQMLLDECLFLCESITTARRQRDLVLEPLQSLVELLSEKENRRQLFLTSLGSQSLQAVLHVFAWIHGFVTTDATVLESPRSPQSDVGNTNERRPILQAAKRLAHHISLDCTISPEAAHAAAKNPPGGAAAARRIRKAILSHPASMQGLVQLVLDDELTERLRDSISEGSDVTLPNETMMTRQMDPTIQGRIKRKQLKLARSGGSCGSPESHSEALSFASGVSAKRSLKFASPKGNVGKAEDVTSSDGGPPMGSRSKRHPQNGEHTCRDQWDDSSSTAILLAVKRIISAKHEDVEESAIDDDQGHEGDDDEGYTEEYNPIVATNQLLASSGALPLLSRALSNALVAAIAQTRYRSGGCLACTAYLSNRICSLASIADAASLFNVNNRVEICNEGFTAETNGYIVVAMMSFLKAFLGIRRRKTLIMGGEYGEIALSILKTLTSLSHENDVVANELKTNLPNANGKNPSQTTGLDILVVFLRQCVVTKAGNERESKMLYDCQIYCLSILANIATNHGCVEILTQTKVMDTEQSLETSFLRWLTKWLISLTESFHNAIMESSFGKSGSIHANRILNQTEEEGLVASGKGFIFLARILLDQDTDEVTEVIFSEIPGETFDEKMKMIKNTLKAFMSFYRQSVGGLSMAIFAPLRALLHKLDSYKRNT